MATRLVIVFLVKESLKVRYERFVHLLLQKLNMYQVQGRPVFQSVLARRSREVRYLPNVPLPVKYEESLPVRQEKQRPLRATGLACLLY